MAADGVLDCAPSTSTPMPTCCQVGHMVPSTKGRGGQREPKVIGLPGRSLAVGPATTQWRRRPVRRTPPPWPTSAGPCPRRSCTPTSGAPCRTPSSAARGPPAMRLCDCRPAPGGARAAHVVFCCTGRRVRLFSVPTPKPVLAFHSLRRHHTIA